MRLIKPEDQGVQRKATVHLVDLAGSERQKRTQAKGDRLSEAKHINRSLSTLASVVLALTRGQAHVPYRDGRRRGTPGLFWFSSPSRAVAKG